VAHRTGHAELSREHRQRVGWRGDGERRYRGDDRGRCVSTASNERRKAKSGVEDGHRDRIADELSVRAGNFDT
jgi:hypothetical protein